MNNRSMQDNLDFEESPSIRGSLLNSSILEEFKGHQPPLLIEGDRKSQNIQTFKKSIKNLSIQRPDDNATDFISSENSIV